MKQDEQKVPRILLSVYACSPEWGSEVGTGWHWVHALSKFFPLHVITEEGFRKSIEAHLSDFDGRFLPEFHYVDIGEQARTFFWTQGDWRFYKHYRNWQKKAYQTALKLHQIRHFDIVHQLGMIGFREPGYLWRLPGNHLFFWGPIGGMGEIPWSYLPSLGVKTGLIYGIKNILNLIQEYGHWRVRKAIRRADMLFAATIENQKCIRTILGKESVLLNETGAEPSRSSVRSSQNECLNIVWCGVMESRKALNLGLVAIQRLKQKKIPVKLHVLGGGHAEKRWHESLKTLNIEDFCVWYGKVEPVKVREVMDHADVMLITSIKEGTPHVLLEALESGLPVVCHNAWGMSSVVNDKCGILVPLKSPLKSVSGFFNALTRLALDKQLLKDLSQGAFARAKELSWDNKAKIMASFYLETSL